MPTSGGTTSTPLSPQQALDAVANLITERGAESPETDQEQDRAPEPAPAPTPPEAPPQPSETEPPASDEPDDSAVEVVIDGETEMVPLSELKKGYSRQADYTRKTQALAEERKTLRSQVEAELQASVQAERQQYLNGLAELRQALEQLTGEPDWVALRGQLSDADFLKQKADWEVAKTQRLRLKAEEDRLAQVQLEQWQQQELQRLRSEEDKLKTAVPEWADLEKGKAELAKLKSFVKQQYGFSDQQVQSGFSSAAIVLLVRDAMRYQELHKAPSPAKPKQAGIKTASPGTPVRPRPNQELVKKLDRVAKTGKPRDAMAAIMDLLPDTD